MSLLCAALTALDLAVDHCCPGALDAVHSLGHLTALTLPSEAPP